MIDLFIILKIVTFKESNKVLCVIVIIIIIIIIIKMWESFS